MLNCEQKFIFCFSLGFTERFAVLTIKCNLWEEKTGIITVAYYKGYEKYALWMGRDLANVPFAQTFWNKA